MRIGLILPLGWFGESDGLTGVEAWHRLRDFAVSAERFGFESIWAFDHVHTVPNSSRAPSFDSFPALGAVAALTRTIAVGHLVVCNPLRNSALVAKMASTLDVVSGGRYSLGIGAGSPRNQLGSYGYDSSTLSERISDLRDSLEILSRLLDKGHGTYMGSSRSISGAINQPTSHSGRIPLIVGGSSAAMFMLAAQFADEVNLDNPAPEDLPQMLARMRRACAKVHRDPSTIRVSAHVRWERFGEFSRRWPALVGEYERHGVYRLTTLLPVERDAGILTRFGSAVLGD